ncbi:MAG TPA: TetR family transcriptional regulator [Solirubrobacterales bacterium]|jgi:AcrR family transcriptional regulator
MAAASGTKKKARKQTKRAGYWALLEAVPRTVARLGFRGLTYRSLAEEAGVTYGLITYHFGTREALIEDAARLAADDAIAGSTLVPESGKVEDFARGLTQLIREDYAGQAFQFELVTEAVRNENLHSTVVDLYSRYIAAVEEALKQFGIEDDPALARVIFAALDGLTLQQFIFQDEAETEKAIEKVRQLITMAIPE